MMLAGGRGRGCARRLDGARRVGAIGFRRGIENPALGPAVHEKNRFRHQFRFLNISANQRLAARSNAGRPAMGDIRIPHAARLARRADDGGDGPSFGRRKGRSHPLLAHRLFGVGLPMVSGVIEISGFVVRGFPLSEAWLKLGEPNVISAYENARGPAESYKEWVRETERDYGPLGSPPRDRGFGGGHLYGEDFDSAVADRIAAERRENIKYYSEHILPAFIKAEARLRAALVRRLSSGDLAAFGIFCPPSPDSKHSSIAPWWWESADIEIDWPTSRVALAGAQYLNVKVCVAAELEALAGKAAAAAAPIVANTTPVITVAAAGWKADAAPSGAAPAPGAIGTEPPLPLSQRRLEEPRQDKLRPVSDAELQHWFHANAPTLSSVAKAVDAAKAHFGADRVSRNRLRDLWESRGLTKKAGRRPKNPTGNSAD